MVARRELRWYRWWWLRRRRLTATTRADRTSITGPLEPFPSNAIGDDIPGEFGYGFGLDVWSDGTPGSALTVEDFNGCSFGATFPVDCTIAGAAFTAGTEYLVAIVIDTDNTAHTYVNGALYADATVGTLAVTATQFWLGRHNATPITEPSVSSMAGCATCACTRARSL